MPSSRPAPRSAASRRAPSDLGAAPSGGSARLRPPAPSARPATRAPVRLRVALPAPLLRDCVAGTREAPGGSRPVGLEGSLSSLRLTRTWGNLDEIPLPVLPSF